jgi:hypothetical protein
MKKTILAAALMMTVISYASLFACDCGGDKDKNFYQAVQEDSCGCGKGKETDKK